ncbi:hypothetical protein T492DRAFT_836716 [Pavlovales sp. CCMP2436]|nr:hypothetical protein T492DRAFT_836716 [Pavlovales sp. CCMP2436]
MQAFLISALAFQQLLTPDIPPAPACLAPACNPETSSLLSREDFTRSLDLLNRAVGGLVHVKTDDTKALKIIFDDMSLYSKIDVKYDAESNVLTVMAEDGEGENKFEATRTVTMPCHVIKPELITAEVLDGNVVVTVPAEAQVEKKVQNKLTNQELDVRIVSGEEKQRLKQ